MAESLSFHDEVAEIVAEQVEAIALVDERAVRDLLHAIDSASRIFLLGEGRSGLVGRMFAMRLMHLGKQAYVVGETITPAIGGGDLLIAISGSGETGTVFMMAEGAKNAGAQIAAITANPESRLAGLADLIVQIPPNTNCRARARANTAAASSSRPPCSSSKRSSRCWPLAMPKAVLHHSRNGMRISNDNP